MTRHPDVGVLEADVLPPEVEAHLAGCGRCRLDRRILRGTEEAESVRALELPDAASLVATWRSVRSGTVVRDLEVDEPPDRPDAAALGPYAIDAFLGRGGMAIVYRVVDRRTGEPRALKLLRTRDADLGRRLRREGRVQAELRHPNLVRVVDVIEVDGLPGLVLEYVPGPSLHAVLRDQTLPIEVVDRVAAEILSGMAAAHAAGVVHRDLKPGNVLLEPGPGGLVARVTDFGLARGGAVGTDSLHTRTGTFAGTPLYMAPEQLRDASRADARSDVFSLGALLYELVTGLRCFAGLDYVDIVRRVADVRWEPVEHARIGVPERMQRAIAAALQPAPQDRPADAAALLDLWSPRSPVAAWPEALVALGVSLHEPEPVSEAPAALPPNNLVRLDDTFVGRTDERARIAAHLATERIVTLTGPGGVGKTRLSQEVARDVAHRWPGGVWLCDLTAARSVDGIAAAVARVLDARLDEDPVARVGQLLAARGPLLVVLDNFEQVVEHAEATVEAWAEAAPEARFLVTSREPLDLFDELVVPLDVLDRGDAADLFVARAARALSAFQVTDDNRRILDDIVSALDGLPLALEVAAARVRHQDLGRLYAHLDRFRGDRHSVLRATLDASWDLLSSAERRALTRLAVFEAPATEAAVQAVLDDLAGEVDSLVQRSLVRRVGERVGLLVTVRAWAAAKRSAEGARSDEERHGRFFAALEGEVDDLDDVLAAYTRAVARSDGDVAARAGLRGVQGLALRGPLSQAITLATEVLARTDLEVQMQGKLRYQRGVAALRLGDHEGAATDLEGALQQLREAGNRALESSCLNNLGHTSWGLGRLADARAQYEAALQVARSIDDQGRVAYLHGALASLSLDEGDHAEARRLYGISLDAHRANGDDRGVALVLGDLGTIDTHDGDYDTGEARIVEAIEILARLGQPVEEAVGWAELGQLYRAAGRRDDAIEAHQRAAALQRRSGAQGPLANSLLSISVLQFDAGELGAAGGALEEALGLARGVGNRRLTGQILQGLSEVRRAQGSEQLADALQQQAAELLDTR